MSATAARLPEEVLGRGFLGYPLEEGRGISRARLAIEGANLSKVGSHGEGGERKGVFLVGGAAAGGGAPGLGGGLKAAAQPQAALCAASYQLLHRT